MLFNLPFFLNLKNNKSLNNLFFVETIQDKIISLRVCVIIPTYNNHKTLKRVIDGVLRYTDKIFVVNDGSTDSTTEILSLFPQIKILEIIKNEGKGSALQLGFKYARASGYKYAITIDSDGQHFPDDIPTFIEALEKEENPVVLIGNRNMNQDGIPKKSSFGNKFSNFWFWFETGIQLEDTQSGYRMYPLMFIPRKYHTNKFEFEIEIIVRMAWEGFEVKNVPVNVLYDANERVSHFRPFKDFTRISILNTILVVITIFYIKPRDLYNSFKKKSLKQFLTDNILSSADSNLKKASSIALGVFIGIAPFWGFQTVLVISLAVLLRLNKVLAFTFSNISFPPFIPLIIFGSFKLGALFVEETILYDSFSNITFDTIKENLIQYVVGSFVLATFMAIIFGLTSYLVLSLFSKSK